MSSSTWPHKPSSLAATSTNGTRRPGSALHPTAPQNPSHDPIRPSSLRYHGCDLPSVGMGECKTGLFHDGVCRHNRRRAVVGSYDCGADTWGAGITMGRADMVKPLSQDLLDFLAGAWSTFTNRFYLNLLAWQATLPTRAPIPPEEIKHML